MDKKTAISILTKLEHTAGAIESLAKSGQIDPRLAGKVVMNIDRFSDDLEVSAFGRKAFMARKAAVITRDPDEPYMDTFKNPNKVIVSDPDEPYMHESGASFNGKSVPTYDQDNSYNMTERDEYNVRGISEWADPTKQQPSWEHGPAGKSTRQGSKRPSKRPGQSKTWAN